jgi:hypothetical protein
VAFLIGQGISTCAAPPGLVSRVPARRASLVVTAGLMLAAGFAAGHMAAAAAKPVAADASLVLLLRFMAAVKLAILIALLALALWRVGLPQKPRLATSYSVALALMAAAPGLIWQMDTVVYGAVLFHAGLLAYAVLALRDDGVWGRANRTDPPRAGSR